MIEDRSRMLVVSVQKLLSRGAKPNIRKILQKTHSADIAQLLQNLPAEKRLELFQMLEGPEKKADVLSHLEPEVQAEFVEFVSKEELLQVVGMMDSDDAADLLGSLPEEESKEILAQMVKEDSEEVADLMGYPEDSAGGLMNSEYMSLNQNLSVAQAIESIQKEGDEGHITFYLYVVNDHNQLVGVISLKQLLLSKRADLLKTIMHKEVISVTVDTDEDEVATAVEKYDFLSLPVVDGNNQLVGVITVDDVIDVIRESAEEDLLAMGRAGWGVGLSLKEHLLARSPWILLAFIGSGFCFALIYFFGQMSMASSEVGELWLLAAFIPIILTLGGTTGSQAATVAVAAIRTGRFEMGKAKQHIKIELQIAFVIALVLGLLIFGIGELVFTSYHMSWVFGVALALQILFATLIGSIIPIGVNRMGLDPTVASVPLFTVLADLAAILILFGLVKLL